MVYQPFAGPQPGKGSGGVPFIREDIDGDGDMPSGPDYNMTTGPRETMGPRALPHVDPSGSMEEWAEELRRIDAVLQEQHTDLEQEIDRATRRKIRTEGQIEMVQVTLRQIEEQLRMFLDTEKRAEKIKVQY